MDNKRIEDTIVPIDNQLKDALNEIGYSNSSDYVEIFQKAIWQFITRARLIRKKDDWFATDPLEQLSKYIQMDIKTPFVLDFGEFMEQDFSSDSKYNLYRGEKTDFIIFADSEIILEINGYKFLSSESNQIYAWMAGFHHKIIVFNGFYLGKFVKVVFPQILGKHQIITPDS